MGFTSQVFTPNPTSMSRFPPLRVSSQPLPVTIPLTVSRVVTLVKVLVLVLTLAIYMLTMAW